MLRPSKKLALHIENNVQVKAEDILILILIVKPLIQGGSQGQQRIHSIKYRRKVRWDLPKSYLSKSNTMFRET